MGKDSLISWCDDTFNSWWGCVKQSPACENCYAESSANRWGWNIWGPAATTSRRLFGDKYWNKLNIWNAAARKAGKPRYVFVGSMMDVMEDHPQVYEARERLLASAEQNPWLVYMLLTKLPENYERFTPWTGEWPRNVWPGTTVENQEWTDKRMPYMQALRDRASVVWLSIEPMLGPIDFTNWQGIADWYIFGGESGNKARPMNPLWVESAWESTGVTENWKFHFKQWGMYVPLDNAEWGADYEMPENAKEVYVNYAGEVVQRSGGELTVKMAKVRSKESSGNRIYHKTWSGRPLYIPDSPGVIVPQPALL